MEGDEEAGELVGGVDALIEGGEVAALGAVAADAELALVGGGGGEIEQGGEFGCARGRGRGC
jgi:hypothetical protein